MEALQGFQTHGYSLSHVSGVEIMDICIYDLGVAGRLDRLECGYMWLYLRQKIIQRFITSLDRQQSSMKCCP